MSIGALIRCASILLAVACGGCAHPIAIAPDLNAMPHNEANTQMPKKVGYFISQQDRGKRVITPGGGGDRVEYAPYGDIESGLYRTLANVFSGVYVIKDLNDKDFILKNDISFIFVPTIDTSSSSSNAFFWPPTDFSVSIACIGLDRDGAQIWQTEVKADGGIIAVKETFSDFGLSGRRATQNALLELRKEIERAPEFRK